MWLAGQSASRLAGLVSVALLVGWSVGFILEAGRSVIFLSESRLIDCLVGVLSETWSAGQLVGPVGWSLTPDWFTGWLVSFLSPGLSPGWSAGLLSDAWLVSWSPLCRLVGQLVSSLTADWL